MQIIPTCTCSSLYKKGIFLKSESSITNFLMIFFTFLQLQSQISQIDNNGDNLFCNKTLHVFKTMYLLLLLYPLRAGNILHFQSFSIPPFLSLSLSSSSSCYSCKQFQTLFKGCHSLNLKLRCDHNPSLVLQSIK